jgi:lauroyl/myristoyl acyltransferase
VNVNEKTIGKILEKLIDRVAILISKIEKKNGIFRGFRRYDIAKSNLKVVLKRKIAEEEIDSVFFYHTLYHFQLLLFPKLKGKNGIVEIEFESPKEKELFEESIKNSGVIAVSGHIGIPEAVSLFFSKKGVKINVLVENLQKKSEKIFFNLTRKNFGLNLFSSLKDMLSQLKQDKREKALVFLVDRPIPGSKETKIFGEKTKITDLPFRISERFEMPVFWILAIRSGDLKDKIPPRPSELNWKIIVTLKQVKTFDEMISSLEKSIKENYIEWNPFFIYDFTF